MLKYTLLNNLWVKEEIIREIITKYFELNKNKNNRLKFVEYR